jgi:hypothetical protein
VIGRSVILDAALSYTEQSPQWPIFPVDHATKKPCIRTGTDHAENASTDPATIERWILRRFPECGVGTPTGAASGTVVIDVDRKHDGEALLAELECALGPLPRVRETRTRSGGLHVYLAHPGNGIRIASVAGHRSHLGRLLGGRDGVDVRADGGIVVLPPSLGYRWISDDDEPLPPMSPMWLAAIQGAGLPPRPAPTPRPEVTPDVADRIRRARAYLARIPGAVEHQAGHVTTFDAVCCVLVGFDLSESDAYDLIAGDYNSRCVPPWNEHELQHKIASAARSCTRERGYLLTARRAA